MLNGEPLPRLPPSPKRPCPLASKPLQARSFRPSAVDVGWRAPRAARSRPRVKFFLLEARGCNSSAVRRTMRTALDGRPLQRVLPISLSQYLADLALVDELERHPMRTRDPAKAGWTIVAAAPVTSQYVEKLGLLGGADGHVARMRALA
eukprot:4482038-Prymnesium_polylepis.1